MREALNDIWLNPKSWEQPDGTNDMMVRPNGERERAYFVAASIVRGISAGHRE